MLRYFVISLVISLFRIFLKENVDIANEIEKKIIAISQGKEVVKDNTKEDVKDSE